MDAINSDLLQERGILVHGCNCHGVMGGGIAYFVAKKWPQVFAAYKELHDKFGLTLGTIQAVKLEDDLYVVNAMTQFDYGTDRVHVDYDAVRKCFKEVRRLAEITGLPVKYPLIGCGLAGGDWNIVSKIIEEEMHGMEHQLYVYNPSQSK